MLNADEILNTLAANFADLSDRFYIEKIGIFGSYATGKQTENSDIDFVVRFKDDCPNLFDVKYELRIYLRKLFNKEVDLANVEFIKPFVMEFIEPEIRYVS